MENSMPGASSSQSSSEQPQAQTEQQENIAGLQKLTAHKFISKAAITFWLFTGIYLVGNYLIPSPLSNSAIQNYRYNCADASCIHSYENFISNIQKDIPISLGLLFIGLFIIFVFYFLLLPFFFLRLYEKIVVNTIIRSSIFIVSLVLSLLLIGIGFGSPYNYLQYSPNFPLMVIGFLLAAVAIGVAYSAEMSMPKEKEAKSKISPNEQLIIASVFFISGLVPLITIASTSILAISLFILGGFINSLFFLKSPTTAPIPTKEEAKKAEKQDDRLVSLQQEVQNNPQSYEAWTELGYRQHELGQENDALASANKAISLNKAYARAWMVRGAALSTMDKREGDAHVALDEALSLDENNVDALYYKGKVYMFQEHGTLAHHMFDKVLARDLMYKDALLSKGTLYIAVENYQGALDVASLLIDRFPNDAVGWRMQGTAYSFQGEKKGVDQQKKDDLLGNALASFDKALEIDPLFAQTYFLKAGPYIAMGDSGKALELLNQGLKIEPNNPLLQEAKADIVGKRTKETTTKIAGTAGRMALGGGIGLAKGSLGVVKIFFDALRKS